MEGLHCFQKSLTSHPNRITLKQNAMLALLHLSDSTLPIGGYAHSAGLETYVQSGKVHDRSTAEAYVINMVSMNLQYNDASFMSLAFAAAMANDIEEIFRLDELCSAFKVPSQLKMSSQKLGIRLIKIFKRYYRSKLIDEYEASIRLKQADGHYCILFGVYASLMEISLDDALTAYYYNAAAGMVTNAVKLIPLGQLDGQDILFRMQPLIKELVLHTITPDISKLGRCNTGFDIAAMQHERLYSRLYMS
jgi:urease accessory protein